jgi:hypothetical protein
LKDSSITIQRNTTIGIPIFINANFNSNETFTEIFLQKKVFG